MSGSVLPRAIHRGYPASVVFHAGVVVLVAAWAVVSAARFGETANAARETVFLAAMVLVSRLFVALPSGIAVLSWWLCRKNGWTPSLGHKGLSVALAVAMIALLAGAVLS